MCQEAFHLSVTKVQKYIDGGPPGMNRVKGCHTKNKQDYHAISGISDNAVADFVKYVKHDGCPAEYRWRPLFNAAKFG